VAEDLLSVLEKHRAIIEQYSEPKTFSAGECIFRIGETGDSAFLIISGDVVISRLVKTREKELATVSDGSIIGEVVLFSGGPRTATARAKTAVETRVFSRQNLADLKVAHLPVAYDFIESILKVTADRLRSTLDRFEVVYFWLS